MTSSYNKKFTMIIDHEYAMAKSVAVSLIKPKPLTVWDIMIPVIFILNFVKVKHSREIFIQNQIFTNTLALEAIRDQLKKSQSRPDVFEAVKKKTKDLLSSVPDGIYSAKIRQAQLKEIDFLMDHYGKLFEVEGNDYATLVRNAYSSRAPTSAGPRPAALRGVFAFFSRTRGRASSRVSSPRRRGRASGVSLSTE